MLNSIQAQELTVASYNIRYSIEKNYKRDSVNGEDWKRRGPAVDEPLGMRGREPFAGLPEQRHHLAPGEAAAAQVVVEREAEG